MSKKLFSAAFIGATLLGASALPGIVSADEGSSSNRAVIYFTRHAEKKTTTVELGPAITVFPYTASNMGSNHDDFCGESKCGEELNAKGLLRAELLADWFDDRDIEVTQVYSSHKTRTRQTVELIAERAGLADFGDMINDGVQQLPSDGTELNPQSTSSSEPLTITAIQMLEPGQVVVIAGHSGTLYDIMEGIGINTNDSSDFPRREDGKVRDFGDLWKVTIKPGQNAKFKWRKNLQPVNLKSVETEPGVVWPPVPE